VCPLVARGFIHILGMGIVVPTQSQTTRLSGAPDHTGISDPDFTHSPAAGHSECNRLFSSTTISSERKIKVVH